jgi:DNA-binding CsgD family transcriptional regulator
MLKQAFTLWKQGQYQRGTSLQRRLIAFFALIILFIYLTFSALILIFDLTGSGSNTVYKYTSSELFHIETAIADDFGRLSVQGVSLSENISAKADTFFKKNSFSPEEIASHPERLEALLSVQMDELLSVMERNSCSGVFILLDATVNPNAENVDFSKAGIFILKTQPNSVQSVGAKNHYLRGPAQIARDNGIELLGQWKMEYDITNQSFFTLVMEKARQNPDKALSRLYYWTGRVTLKGNSESGFLLCVPLRSENGTVFGVCGIEVSDRMFKQLYSPKDSDYKNVFTIASPCESGRLLTRSGLIAGNYYLSDFSMEQNLTILDGRKGFSVYESGDASYGGLQKALCIYPSGSIYENEAWAASVMMPYEQLEKAITGNTPYLLILVLFLLVLSLMGSIWISCRYLRPVNEALDKIRNKRYSTDYGSPYVEINDLMEFLAKQDEKEKSRKVIIPASDGAVMPMFEEFLKNVKTLSPAEKSVFDLYIKGYKAQEIAEELYLSINTIKTHNRRIFAKLNVASRNELLVYINMMKEMNMIKE